MVFNLIFFFKFEFSFAHAFTQIISLHTYFSFLVTFEYSHFSIGLLRVLWTGSAFLRSILFCCPTWSKIRKNSAILSPLFHLPSERNRVHRSLDKIWRDGGCKPWLDVRGPFFCWTVKRLRLLNFWLPLKFFYTMSTDWMFPLLRQPPKSWKTWTTLTLSSVGLINKVIVCK